MVSNYEKLLNFCEEKWGVVECINKANEVLAVNNISLTFLEDCECDIIDGSFCIREFISPYCHENQWHPIA